MLTRYLASGLLSLTAACGQQSVPATDVPPSNDTTAPTTSATSRNFEISISGDLETTITPGSGTAEFYADMGSYELFFGTMSRSVFFVLAEDITAGTYPLEAYDDMRTDQTAAVEVSALVDPDDITAGAENYNNGVEGTITLDEIADTISGSFEFTATSDDSDANTTKTVTVTGTFSELPIRQGE